VLQSTHHVNQFRLRSATHCRLPLKSCNIQHRSDSSCWVLQSDQRHVVCMQCMQPLHSMQCSTVQCSAVHATSTLQSIQSCVVDAPCCRCLHRAHTCGVQVTMSSARPDSPAVFCSQNRDLWSACNLHTPIFSACSACNLHSTTHPACSAFKLYTTILLKLCLLCALLQMRATRMHTAHTHR